MSLRGRSTGRSLFAFMSAALRVLTMDDFDAVLALWKNTEGVGLNESDSRENIALYLQRNPRLSFVVQDDAGKIVGAILGGHDGRRGYLHHLAVAREQRGKGMGRQLVEACLAGLKQAGITRCNIFVYAANEEGQAFWKHFGWQPRAELLVLQRPV